MAHLVRPWIVRYLDKDGRRVPKGTPGARKVRKRSRKWYAQGLPGLPPKKRVPLASDKTAAAQLLADLVRKGERRQANVLGPEADHAKRPLREHLADFEAELRSRANTPAQVQLKVGRVRRLLDDCGFTYPADIADAPILEYLARIREQPRPLPVLDPAKEWYTRDELAALLDVGPAAAAALAQRHRLEAVGGGRARRYPRATAQALHARRGRPRSAQTANYYLREIKSFCRWLVRGKRLAENPVIHLQGGNPRLDRRHDRRDLAPAELLAVLEAARTSPKVFRGLAGADRYHLYLAACGTGFRASELASLPPDWFRLDGNPPVVALPAREGKNRKPIVQPLPAGVAEALRGYLAGKPAGCPVWPGTWSEKAADMLRIDLDAAGVPYVVEGPDGPLFADFHALRHTFITLLERAGLSPKVAQELARHSDIRLTLNRYTHAGLTVLGEAVQRLELLAPAGGPAVPENSMADVPRPVLEALAVLGLAGLAAGIFGYTMVAPRVAPNIETAEERRETL